MHRRCIHFTLEGRPVLSFHVDRTRDGGFVFSPDLPQKDIHLTVFEKDGKIRSHTHHGGIEESNNSPLGRVVSTRVVSDALNKMLRRRLKPYHGNMTCYVFTRERWRRIKMFLPQHDEAGNLVIPIESLMASLNMDFGRKDLWEKIRVRSLLSHEPHFGFMKTSAGLRKVIPISEKLMFVWSLMKANELGDYITKVSGVDDFFDYLKSVGVSKQMLADMMKKIQEPYPKRKPKTD